MSEYQPGTCNIGAHGRRRRRFGGTIGFLVAVAYVIAVIIANMPTDYLLGTVLFLFGGFTGVFQARFGFCVAFAALARYDLSGSGGGSGSISEQTALRRDRRQALKITLYAAVAAVSVTVVLYGIALATL